MNKKLALALAAVVVAASTVMGGTVSASADVNVYTTPGTHHVNGRDWNTSCEAYSQTKRCRTNIKATQVSEVNGKFVAKTDWVFNNLTYLPSPRTLWTRNPLGGNGAVGAKIAWTAPDGRKWSTECDNATTGSNGCRSYTESKVIEAYQSKGAWNYRWVTKKVFNNIVMFSGPATNPVKPTPPATVNVPDTNLRECINDELDQKDVTKAITKASATAIDVLACDGYGVANLTGLEQFSNLEFLSVDENEVKSLAPLKGLRKLEMLFAYDNNISDVSPLAGMQSLQILDIDTNSVTDVTPLAKLTNVFYLDLTSNKIAKVAPLAKLPNIEVMGLFDNPITDRGSLKPLLDRGVEIFFDGPIDFED